PRFAREHFYLPHAMRDPFGNISRVRYDRHTLLPVETEDPVGNRTTAVNDYRLLRPSQVIDPNGNRTAARCDGLGMVTAWAQMGKENQHEADTLEDPTTRLEYDLFNWRINHRPVFVHTFAREQHGTSNPRWQETYIYSDGNGREVMQKVQAEPG